MKMKLAIVIAGVPEEFTETPAALLLHDASGKTITLPVIFSPLSISSPEYIEGLAASVVRASFSQLSEEKH